MSYKVNEFTVNLLQRIDIDAFGRPAVGMKRQPSIAELKVLPYQAAFASAPAKPVCVQLTALLIVG